MIPLYIPYFNRPDLLEAAIASAVKAEAVVDVKVINNSGESFFISGAEQMVPSVPLFYGMAQNWMLQIAKYREQPFWLSMHADAEAGEGSIQRLVELAEKYTRERKKWGVIFTNYDALAAHNTEAYNAVGGWDKHIPTYFGDTDLFHRLRIAGYETIDTDIPCLHHGSSVIRSDPKTKFLSDLVTQYAHDYYLRKWGGLPGYEVFRVPFDRPDLFA